jgi:hypothetical protein
VDPSSTISAHYRAPLASVNFKSNISRGEPHRRAHGSGTRYGCAESPTSPDCRSSAIPLRTSTSTTVVASWQQRQHDSNLLKTAVKRQCCTAKPNGALARAPSFVSAGGKTSRRRWLLLRQSVAREGRDHLPRAYRTHCRTAQDARPSAPGCPGCTASGWSPGC